jgi:hypothetical protein
VNDYPTDPADILEQAADLLETKGWCRGFFEDNAGRHCAVGAIRYVTGQQAVEQEIYALGTTPNMYLCKKFKEVMTASVDATNILAERLQTWRSPDDYVYIPTWNDEADRTADEVIDLMKHTAKDLRNRKEAA